MRILVFDSGMGNRPIAEAIKTYLPKVSLYLLSDTAYFPYGEKTDDELTQRVIKVIEAALGPIQPDIMVLACNTLSTIALDEIRTRVTMPVVGVVPAIKPAAQASKSRVIGLIATPATINRKYTDKLIVDFAADCTVIRVGSTKLVRMAEDYMNDGSVDMQQLEVILQPFLEARESQGLDQLVLGCTHFPILKSHISKLLSGVDLQDSNDAIGREVLRQCEKLTTATMNSESGQGGQYCYNTTIAGQIVAI